MSIGRFLGFFSVLLVVLGSLHYYVWTRLVRDAHLPAPWSTVATWAVVSLGALLIVAMPSSFLLPRSVSGPILWVGFTWMGIAFFVVVLLAAGDLARGALSIARAIAGDGSLDMERRVFLGRLIAGLAAGIAFSLGAFGVVNMARRVRVKQVRVPLAKLRAAKSGYRIVQLSDVHIGPTLGASFLDEVVEETNALKPDLVVITGDLVDGRVAQLAPHVAPLAKLQAKDGVYFVTGNHEYYSGVDEWLAHLATLGVRVLRNEHVRIGGDDGFDLAGVDDWTARQVPGHGPDLARALEGRDPARALVLLAHQPKQIVEAAARGVDLQLSGHTHGGQLFPFNFLVHLQQPYVAGLHVHDDKTAIYVSCGTGYWGPPMRLGAPAEITSIELASA